MTGPTSGGLEPINSGAGIKAAIGSILERENRDRVHLLRVGAL